MKVIAIETKVMGDEIGGGKCTSKRTGKEGDNPLGSCKVSWPTLEIQSRTGRRWTAAQERRANFDGQWHVNIPEGDTKRGKGGLG